MTKGLEVSVIGLGYVGLPLALLASKKGYKVTGVDLDSNKVRAINSKIDPIEDEYVSRHIKSSKLKAQTNYKSISNSTIVLVCVPTPVKNGLEPDLGILRSAVKSLAQQLKPDTLVIIESTINPGVCDELVIPQIEKSSGLKVNKDFDVVHCPERINPGDKKWTIENIPRVVGASSKKGLKLAVKFYETIINAPIKPMGSLKEAEAVKIVENSFRDVNIAFVNELALSFNKIGINVKNVIDGAATKPFAYMAHYPSVGVGGHCIPVDPYYLIEYARGHGFDHEFLSLARTINNRMPSFTVDRLVEGLNEAGIPVKSSAVAVLGLAYKPNVADDRESPSYKVIEILKSKGIRVKTYDPHIPEKSTSKTLRQAIDKCQAVIVATNHREFASLPRVQNKFKLFIDGKNAYKKSDFKDKSVIYKGIGT